MCECLSDSMQLGGEGEGEVTWVNRQLISTKKGGRGLSVLSLINHIEGKV